MGLMVNRKVCSQLLRQGKMQTPNDFHGDREREGECVPGSGLREVCVFVEGKGGEEGGR